MKALPNMTFQLCIFCAYCSALSEYALMEVFYLCRNFMPKAYYQYR